MPSADQLLSILCDALDERDGVIAALDELPFERPAPPSLLHKKIMSEQRVNEARKACEWTINSFRAKRYDF
jgi:hypothetical protein